MTTQPDPSAPLPENEQGSVGEKGHLGEPVNYDGPDPSVECSWPPCVNRLRKTEFGGPRHEGQPQWCSKEHRELTLAALDIVVATRDASWFDHPSTDRPVVYHVVVEGYVSACTGLPLVAESESKPHRIDQALYCRRKACSNRWRNAVDARI